MPDLIDNTFIEWTEASGDLTGKVTRVEEEVDTTASSGASLALNLSSGSVFIVTLDDNCTLSFTSVPSTAFGFTVELRQDGTGSRTVSWPAAVTWAGGTAPTLSTGASAVDVVTLFTPDGGTTYRGFLAGADFS